MPIPPTWMTFGHTTPSPWTGPKYKQLATSLPKDQTAQWATMKKMTASFCTAAAPPTKRDLIQYIYLTGKRSNGRKLLQDKTKKHPGKELIIQLNFFIHTLSFSVVREWLTWTTSGHSTFRHFHGSRLHLSKTAPNLAPEDSIHPSESATNSSLSQAVMENTDVWMIFTQWMWLICSKTDQQLWGGNKEKSKVVPS